MPFQHGDISSVEERREARVAHQPGVELVDGPVQDLPAPDFGQQLLLMGVVRAVQNPDRRLLLHRVSLRGFSLLFICYIRSFLLLLARSFASFRGLMLIDV